MAGQSDALSNECANEFAPTKRVRIFRTKTVRMDLRRTAYYPVMNDPSAAPPHRPFHHTDHGFRNNYPAGWRRGSFWKWQRDRWIKGVAKPPPGGWRFPSEIPNRAWLRANRSEPTVTWLGHSTFLVQIDGVNVLTRSASLAARLTVQELRPAPLDAARHRSRGLAAHRCRAGLT